MALQPYAGANERSGRRRILLVEDEPFVREATCSILQNAGFEVLPAEDARAAMELYEECGHRVDLVMTDMVLPGRTGQQLGQDVRKRSPEVAVLVTSGYGEAGQFQSCLETAISKDALTPMSGQTIWHRLPW